jgi:DNA-binding Lrp family transcriptional regulator
MRTALVFSTRPVTQMDDIDLKLLASLKEDAKRKYSDLADLLNLSAPSVHARVKKLEQLGVIESYTINLNPKMLGAKLTAFVRVTTEGVSCADIPASFEPYPEVEELHSVAGEESLLLKVRTRDTESLDILLDQIRKIPGVRKTVTSIVLGTRIDRGTDPTAFNPAANGNGAGHGHANDK